jgi:hypothetical protein
MRYRVGLASLPCLSLLLSSCGSRETPAAPPPSEVAAFAASGSEVAALVRGAKDAPRATHDGVLLETRGLAATISPGGRVALQGETHLAFRIEADAGRTSPAPRIEDRYAVIDGSAPALIFDRGAQIELLHRLASRVALAYVVELPPGHALARVDDGAGGVVEVRDRAGVARVRLTADTAWDRAGHRIPVRLRVADARVSFELPEGAAYPVVVDPAWSATTFPVRLRNGHTSTLLATGEILLAGGGTATAEVFDPRSGRFRAVGSMTSARPGHSATTLQDGTVLVAGGTDATTEIYDPATQLFHAGPRMNALTGANTAVRLVGGSVLVVGGSLAERYDPTTATWKTLARKTAASGATVLLANGDVLLAGNSLAERYRAATDDFVSVPATTGPGATCCGFGRADGSAIVFDLSFWITPGGLSGSNVNSAWLFDPVANKFTQRTATSSAPTLSLLHPSGQALFIGAGASSYDAASDKFTAGDTLPQDQQGGSAIVLPSGAVLITGGNSGGASLYQGSGALGPGSYTAAGSVSMSHVGPRLTRLLDRRVLLTGGTPQAGNTTDSQHTAEIWNPTTRAWSAAGKLGAQRVRHAQALLPSGKVLVVGGLGESSAEIFDPATGAFAKAASLSTQRDGASATTLPNGKVLVAGGSGASTAELYDEASGAFSVLSSTMASGHSSLGGVLLPTGRVLLIDGLASEIFDPATGTFTHGPSLSTARNGRTASVLPNGDVVVGGGTAALLLERFDASSNTFAITGPMSGAVIPEAAAPLPFGRVYLGMGTDQVHEFSSSASWIFDALGEGGRGASAANPVAASARMQAQVTQTADGALLVAGGDDCASACASPTPTTLATWTFEPLGPASSARPTILTAPSSIAPGAAFDVTGKALVGTRETSVVASTRVPIFVYVPVAGQGSVQATTLAFTDTSAKVQLPATGYRGKGYLHASVSGITGPGVLVDLGPAANGAACNEAADCGSGFCVDGVCCDSVCQGVCLACTAAQKGSGVDGVCGAIPPGQSATDACALFQGAPCAADAQCATGLCVDGVCCDARCDGQCEACNAEGSSGTCVPVLGAPKGKRAACDAGADPCSARRCDGTERKSCAGYAPSTTSCRVAGCTTGVATLAATCTGAGVCPTAATKPCEPFACGDTQCLTRCTADSECASSYRCTAGKCVAGAYCSNEHTLSSPGAADLDCAPYLCAGQACKTTCASSSECVGGYLCGDGTCVPATPASTSSGGCAIGGDAGARAGVTLGALGALGALGLLARWRRRARPHTHA